MINAITGVQAIILDPTYKAKTASDNESNQELAQRSMSTANIKSNEKNDLGSQAAKDNKVSYNELADTLKNILDEQNISLEFRLDESTNKMVLKIIDSDTEKVIRQIPSEIALKISRLVAELLGNGQVADAKI
ncbi:MAG: flagellar protein FlaG [Chloroherpetonaceae bacterium]|nr:flagellar protein FlaG [bacterium]